MTKIFLTGGSGMVGRNILQRAERHAYDVVAPSSRACNLLDYNAVKAALLAEKPDIVIHAAGHVGGIQANIAAPVRFLADNWTMGSHLIQAAREAGVERLLNIGSSCMYPKDQETPLREEQVLRGALEPTNEGYALAKCAIARLCQYVVQEAPDLTYKTLIPCNLYGLFDKFDPAVSHLVPAILHKLHEAKRSAQAEVPIWGDGSARREFMFAGDLADAVFYLLTRLEDVPQNLNIGPGEDYSVTDYYRAGANVVGYGGRFTYDTTKPVGMKRKLLNVSRLKALGWQPPTSLTAGLQQTYAHYVTLGASS